MDLTEEQIEYLPRVSIVPDPDQPREYIDPEHIERLAVSIRERGKLLNPIRTRWDDALQKDVIVNGNCRFLALEKAGIDTVPVIRSPGNLSPFDTLVEQLVDNAIRADLRPVEQARALYEIRQQSGGKSNTELARRLGLSPSDFTVADALLSLTPEQQHDVDAGLVGKQTAYYLARVEELAMRSELWQQARSGQLNKERAIAAVRSRASQPVSNAAACGRVTLRIGSLSLTWRDGDGSPDALLELIDAIRKELRSAIGQGRDLKTLARELRARNEPATAPSRPTSGSAGRPGPDDTSEVAAAV